MDPAQSVVMSVPPRRRVTTSDDGLMIEAVTTGSNPVSRPWTVAPVRFPVGAKPGSFSVKAAIALEWCVDVVVEYQTGDVLPHVELWRVGPWGLRASPIRLTDQDGRGLDSIASATPVETWGGGLSEDGWRENLLELTHLGDHTVDHYDLRTDALHFRAEAALVASTQRDYDVFVSYKHADTGDFAAQLNERLRTAGLHTWFGPDRTYSDYREAIRLGIKHSAHFLLILSEHSFDRPSTKRRFGAPRGAEPDLVQATEIDLILERLGKFDGGMRFLCNHSWPSAEPANAAQLQQLVGTTWQLQTPERLNVDLEDDNWPEAYATALAKRIYRDIDRSRGGR